MSRELLVLPLFKDGTLKATRDGHIYRLKSYGKTLPHERDIQWLSNDKRYFRINVTVAGKFYHFMVHRVIWTVFNGPIPKHLEMNHINANKHDNSIANLEVVTHSENMRHADMLGLREFHNGPKGEKHCCSILRRAQVSEIRATYESGGISQEKIGDRYGVSRGCVRDIVNRVNWKHIK